MVFKGLLPEKTKAYILFCVRDRKEKPSKVSTDLGVSLATIYRIKKSGLSSLKSVKKKGGPGRPRKISVRMERQIIRQVQVLRKDNPNFCSGRLLEACGIHIKNVSNRTVRRRLNEHGYGYMQTRKKGVLTCKDLIKRYKFAKEVKKNRPTNFWTSQINFYLDGVSFYYKRNPADQARAPQGRIWRTKKEGLAEGCTAKGSKEGSGGKVVKLFVSISYNKGVIACDPYEKLDGPYFEGYVRRTFPGLFQKAEKGRSMLWLQDGDPSQNSAAVKKVLKSIKAELFSIPPRSPDVNPIENLFHLVRKELTNQALQQNITQESYEEFKNRIIATFLNFPSNTIDNIIDSMNKRIDLIIRSKGNRIKY